MLGETTNSQHPYPRYENLVKDLQIVRPEQVWVSGQSVSTVQPPAGVEVTKTDLVAADAQVSEKEAKFEVGYTLKEAGATIAPFIPAFYQKPASVDDLMDHFIMRLFDHLGLDSTLSRRWA